MARREVSGVAVDRGSRLDRTVESLGRAREMLARYRGTPCEQDYAAMVRRYERRVAVLVRESMTGRGA